MKSLGCDLDLEIHFITLTPDLVGGQSLCGYSQKKNKTSRVHQGFLIIKTLFTLIIHKLVIVIYMGVKESIYFLIFLLDVRAFYLFCTGLCTAGFEPWWHRDLVFEAECSVTELNV